MENTTSRIEFIKDYMKKGFSMNKIGKILGIDPHRISTLLKRFK